LYLGYFGSAWPPHYGIRPNHFLPSASYVVRPEPERYPLRPGIYAISATVLNEVYSQFRGPWSPERERTYRHLQAKLATSGPVREGDRTDLDVFDQIRFARLCKYLQTRAPDALVGYSILIF